MSNEHARNWMLISKEGQVARVSRALYGEEELPYLALGKSTFRQGGGQAMEHECVIRSYGKKDEETLQILDLRAASMAALQSQAFTGLTAAKENAAAAETTVAQYRQDADAAGLVPGAEALLKKKQENVAEAIAAIQNSIGEVASVTIRRCGRQMKVILEDTDWLETKGILPFTALIIGIVPYPENFKGWADILQSVEKDRKDVGEKACLVYSADNRQRKIYFAGYGNRKVNDRQPENSVGVIMRLAGDDQAVLTVTAKITDKLVVNTALAKVVEGGRGRYEFAPDQREAPAATEKKPASRKDEHLRHRPLEGLGAILETGDEKPVEVTAEVTPTPEAPVTTTPEAPVTTTPEAVVAEATLTPEAPTGNADGECTASVDEQTTTKPIRPPRKPQKPQKPQSTEDLVKAAEQGKM